MVGNVYSYFENERKLKYTLTNTTRNQCSNYNDLKILVSLPCHIIKLSYEIETTLDINKRITFYRAGGKPKVTNPTVAFVKRTC